MPRPKQPKQPSTSSLQTIDPQALTQVAGGAKRSPASSGDDNGAVMEALNGIIDALGDVSRNRNQGFGPTEMMMFAMIMSGRNQGPTVVAAPANPYGAGYYVDGVFKPFT